MTALRDARRSSGVAAATGAIFRRVAAAFAAPDATLGSRIDLVVSRRKSSRRYRKMWYRQPVSSKPAAIGQFSTAAPALAATGYGGNAVNRHDRDDLEA